MNPELKKLLLRRGAEVAGQLSAVLDHKEVKLTDLPPPKKPNEDPEIRLRRFLEQIDRAIKAFGTDRFGRCSVCGTPLDPQLLAERPWLESCPKHPPV